MRFPFLRTGQKKKKKQFGVNWQGGKEKEHRRVTNIKQPLQGGGQDNGDRSLTKKGQGGGKGAGKSSGPPDQKKRRWSRVIFGKQGVPSGRGWEKSGGRREKKKVRCHGGQRKKIETVTSAKKCINFRQEETSANDALKEEQPGGTICWPDRQGNRAVKKTDGKKRQFKRNCPGGKKENMEQTQKTGKNAETEDSHYNW